MYNEILRELKKKLLNGDLGGERKEMWYQIRSKKLGLVAKGEHNMSDVSDEDAKAFMSAK